jgi:hypothetical protein
MAEQSVCVRCKQPAGDGNELVPLVKGGVVHWNEHICIHVLQAELAAERERADRAESMVATMEASAAYEIGAMIIADARLRAMLGSIGQQPAGDTQEQEG